MTANALANPRLPFQAFPSAPIGSAPWSRAVGSAAPHRRPHSPRPCRRRSAGFGQVSPPAFFSVDSGSWRIPGFCRRFRGGPGRNGRAHALSPHRSGRPESEGEPAWPTVGGRPSLLPVRVPPSTQCPPHRRSVAPSAVAHVAGRTLPDRQRASGDSKKSASAQPRGAARAGGEGHPARRAADSDVERSAMRAISDLAPFTEPPLRGPTRPPGPCRSSASAAGACGVVRLLREARCRPGDSESRRGAGRAGASAAAGHPRRSGVHTGISPLGAAGLGCGRRIGPIRIPRPDRADYTSLESEKRERLLIDIMLIRSRSL